MATAEAITYCGAKPVFVDIDERTYTMDPAGLEEAITKRTKAIIPVHLFGQPADMDPILEIARAHGLFVIEDAAQAHGAEYKGRRAGSFGDAGCFSFYPGKNLGAFGEAGAVVTDNNELQEKIRILRDHGQIRKYHHTMVGWNCRMDGIQAAVLRIKLRHLEKGNELRRSHAAQYDRALEGLEEIVTPLRRPLRPARLSHLRDSRKGKGRSYSATWRNGHRVRNPLSGPSPPARGLFEPRIRSGFIPDCGTGCQRVRFVADVSGAHSRPNRHGRGEPEGGSPQLSTLNYPLKQSRRSLHRLTLNSQRFRHASPSPSDDLSKVRRAHGSD